MPEEIDAAIDRGRAHAPILVTLAGTCLAVAVIAEGNGFPCSGLLPDISPAWYVASRW